MLFLTLCCAAMTLWTYFSFSYLQAAERAVAVRGETLSLRVGIYNDKPYPFTRMRVEVACADPAQRIALALDLAPAGISSSTWRCACPTAASTRWG